MSLGGLVSYLGLGFLYAAALSVLIWLAARTWRGRAARWDALALLPGLFFVMLTHHPFPDPASLDCSEGGVAPILQPFDSLSYFVRLAQRGATVQDWMRHQIVQATVMNFVLCVLAGIGFARFLRTWQQAILVGLVMSLVVEISQLTGLFGLYPCAYRTFEVDDLILNTLGVLTGFLIAPMWVRRVGLEGAAHPPSW
ncbi:MAG: VanZ family protein [Pseudomonadota bacterium]